MSVTTQFTTYSDLYTGVQNMVRAQLTQADPLSQTKRAVNVALQDMHLGTEYQFYWAERDASVLTQDDYSTGTVSFPQGSQQVNGDETNWLASNGMNVANVRVGGKMVFAGNHTVFTVTGVSANTTATVDIVNPHTVATGSSYRYFEDEYALAADYLRPVDMQFFDDERQILLIDRRSFKRHNPRNSVVGRPRAACQIELGPDGSTAMRPRIVFSPPPDNFYQIPYSYITSNLVVASDGTLKTGFTADDDEPIVPLRYRHAIYWYALMLMYQHKDDVRRAEAFEHYRDIMRRTLQDVSVGDRRARIEPQVGHYWARAERPYSGGGRSRRWDFHDSFDRRE